MLSIILIGLGGFLGATSRYVLGAALSKFLFSTSIPYSTAAINLIGCFLFGAIAALGAHKVFPPQVGLFLIVGFLGSFTTFSAYSYESLCLLEQGHVFQMMTNILLQSVLGMVFVSVGYSLFTKCLLLLNSHPAPW